MRARSLLLILPFVALLAGGASRDLSSRAKGNLAAVVSDADYPESAIRAEAQGVVSFTLDVGADGRVTACSVDSSSGSAALDQTTCRIMVERMNFVPAHDRKGRPTTDRIHSRMRWILPRDANEDGNQAAPAGTPPAS